MGSNSPVNSNNNGLMQCLTLDLKNERLNFLAKCPMPKLTSDNDQEVVVKVALSGLCGTDLHIVEGKFQSVDGLILGHECVGTVSEVAKNEKVFHVGERVAINPNVTCGVCDECRRNRPNYCLEGGMKYTIGVSTNGGFAQYCKVRTSLVYKLSDSLDFNQAVLAEPLSCIMHGLDVIPPIVIGWRILVIGAGIIGLLWSSLLHHMGHRNVFVVQRSSARRKTFEKLELGFNALSWEEVSECATSCENWKFDMLIDTSGNSEAMAKALPLLRNRGVLVIFGVADPAKTIQISPFEMYKKELTIVGTAINTHTSFQKALDMLAAMGNRYFTNERLNMKTFKLKDYEVALKDLSERKYTKVIFDCN